MLQGLLVYSVNMEKDGEPFAALGMIVFGRRYHRKRRAVTDEDLVDRGPEFIAP